MAPAGRSWLVASHLGPELNRLLEAAVPGSTVVAVAPDGPVPDLRGVVALVTGPRGAPNLPDVLDRGVRWVHALGTGVDRFPLDALGEDVVLTCSRGASAVPIAEFVLAAMLAFEKRLPETWVQEPPPRWASADLGGLEGRTLGLVGLGGIGTAVAQRALAFDMEVRAVRRTAAPAPGVVVCADLGEVLAVADHLVLAAALTPATRHIIDAAALAQVKRGVHLVNIARGALVDHEALLAALDDGRVAAASLDVTDPEPLPAGHPLYGHPRVRLSPHVSWSAPGAMARLVECFAEELRRHQAGQPPLGVVDRHQRY